MLPVRVERFSPVRKPKWWEDPDEVLREVNQWEYEVRGFPADIIDELPAHCSFVAARDVTNGHTAAPETIEYVNAAVMQELSDEAMTRCEPRTVKAEVLYKVPLRNQAYKGINFEGTLRRVIVVTGELQERFDLRVAGCHSSLMDGAL